MTKLLTFLTLVFVFIFSISRMILAGRDVLDTGENPTSTYATIAIEILCILVIFLNINKIKIKKGFILITTLWLIWIFISTIFMDAEKFRHIVFMSFWPLTTILFYFLTKNYKNFFSTVCKYFPYLLIILLFIFFQSIVIHRQMFFLRASNLIFYPILLLPWLLTMKNRIFKNILIIILIIAVVLSFKRAALIFTLLSVLIYVYYEYFSNKRINRLKGFSIAIFVIAITAGVFININKQYDNLILSRFENLEEDKGSGRLNRYEDVIHIQKQSNAFEFLFGHGFRTVEKALMKSSGSAHNDFLEVLYDYGLIGLLIYLSFHFYLIKKLRFLIKTKSPYKTGYLISYIIFFVMSMVSHLIIYPTYFIFLTTYWGSVEAMIEIEKQNKISIYETTH